jgi:NAD(P)-dependent dehydrogenase (short-subunit alcohol dehydrogenase family)
VTVIAFDYSGKTALITGAARGLGFAIARAFLRAGATVILNDRKPADVDRAIDRLGGGNALMAAPADLSSPAGAVAAVAAAHRLQKLDFLINNAAVNVEKPMDETTDAHWDEHIAVVLSAAFFTARAALPLLKASRGCIVNISSELGLHAIANNVAYVSAKHGVLALTRALAIELAPSGIRVNALCPGTMDTELMRACAADSGDPEAYYRNFRAYHPLRRLASPEEVADFVLCMVSPAAAFMTGSPVVLDGGSTAGRM